MRDLTAIGVALLAVTGCLLLITPDITDFLRSADAGSQLTKGYAILHGRHPFVDIDSSVYGPAIFYLTAFGQWIAGRPGSELIIILVGYALAFGLLFRTLQRQSPGLPLYAFFVVACALTLPVFHKYHVMLPPAIFLACLAAADASGSAGSRGAWLGGGSAAAGLFRLDFGGYCVIASLLFLALKWRRGESPELHRAVVTMFGVGALLAGPWALYLGVAVGPLESISRFAETTAGVYAGLAKPLPPFDITDPVSAAGRLTLSYWSLKLLPWIVVATVAVRLVATSARAANPDHAFVVAGSVAAALFYLQASHRIDLNHVQQVFAPVALMAIVAASHAWRSRHRLVAGTMLTALVGATVFIAVDARILRQSGTSVARTATILEGWFAAKPDIVDRALAQRPHASPAYGIRRARELTEAGAGVLFLPYSAQSYYFADRMFDTPFGWLNPGRFRQPGAEQRFIQAMEETVFIVDDPGFSFDGMMERNMRSYAPLLSQHIYSRYGILEVAGRTVLLSNDRETLRRHGSYALALTPAASRESDRPWANLPPPDDPDRPAAVATINTLPTATPAGSRAARLPAGGGLLLGLADRGKPGAETACALLADRHDRSGYRVTTPAGDPVGWSSIGARDLIDTRAVKPGRYQLLKVSGPACGSSEVNAAAPAAAERTGVVIEILAESPSTPAPGAART